MRTQYCGLVSAAYLDQIVTLCGWVHRRRDHGGVIFIDLRDREGLVQVVCDPDRADMFQVAESVRNEFVLKITGKVKDDEPRRPLRGRLESSSFRLVNTPFFVRFLSVAALTGLVDVLSGEGFYFDGASARFRSAGSAGRRHVAGRWRCRRGCSSTRRGSQPGGPGPAARPRF